MGELSLMDKYAPFLGRLLVGTMFMVSVVVLMGQFHRVIDLMGARGIPFAAPLLILIISLWLIGAVSIISGYKIREASICLFVVLIPVTLTIHNPWNADAAHFQNELNHFLKNMAILGGLLYLATFGPGPLSIGESTRRRR